jgi:hypothetical protein
MSQRSLLLAARANLNAALALPSKRVGVGWWPALQDPVKAQALGSTADRVEVAPNGPLAVTTALAAGSDPLVLANPAGGSVGPLGLLMYNLGLGCMELGNEVYYHGYTAAGYAAVYKAAREALGGTGVLLGANAWGDYQSSPGVWSQVEAGGGWCVDFCKALGSKPDRWTFHPYGPLSAYGFGNTGTAVKGWGTLPRLHEYNVKAGVDAPFWITEVGVPTWTGSDGAPAVTEADQAVRVTRYITDFASWPWAEQLYIYGAIDGPNPGGIGGYGLWRHDLSAKPAVAAFAAAAKAAGLA